MPQHCEVSPLCSATNVCTILSNVSRSRSRSRSGLGSRRAASSNEISSSFKYYITELNAHLLPFETTRRFSRLQSCEISPTFYRITCICIKKHFTTNVRNVNYAELFVTMYLENCKYCIVGGILSSSKYFDFNAKTNKTYLTSRTNHF